MKIKLNNVRLAFPELFEPTQVSGQGAFKYRANFLIPKSRTDLIEEIKAGIKHVIGEKWGNKDIEKIYNSICNNPNRFCLRDGDSKEYDGYAGNLYLSASNKSRPLVIDRNTSPLTAQDGRPYSGCYVNATVEFYGYDNNGKGVSASLRGVQFFRDGDAFTGGGVASVEEFDDLSMAAEEELLAS
ncbi:DUF2815 family protein [Bacteriophage APSE-2]|uniref:DUF2815 family protein n=2 Tax=root TaxID=1 RepID=A0A6F9EXS2_9CAUD|nr:MULTISPECIES: DUF2815 family protein [Pseudomonadota]CAB3635696.1 DUF2815 family protein [Hamiltonella phage APSE-8]CAB3775466.1 DUF2815 family protein [Bacteriophage APSE-2]ATW32046.1 hypothetical protein BJP42_06835 [Candidatus Hamiltonella defensa]ATW33882.1 hypothetical protein BJP43_05950 [Candidatus Hamiltonella defensa]AWK17068.1 hypothetical protein CCS40_09030 [Candidatus Hamiltonella defensa]